jgi:dTDP-4-dehydrorhamnose reductase
MQIVIVGAGGMLGRDVSKALGERHPSTVCATRDEIDITDYWGTRWELERLNADVVVNCAAFTDVDGCETQAEKAFQVNAEGPGNLARACTEVGARIVHLSTDFVFDGSAETPYREQDPTNPQSVYARSKLEGEQQVMAGNPDHVILRCAWLYGPGGRNFISAILEAARAGEPVRVVTDQRGTPTYTHDLALAVARIVGVKAAGVIHFANSGVCSRYEFAQEALQLAGLEAPLEPIHTAQLQDRPARRPAFSALDTGRFTELTGILPRPWQETLVDYLKETS